MEESRRDIHGLARKFAETWQLNVTERRNVQMQPLSGSMIVEAIADIVRSKGWYPADWRPDDDFDGGLIELLPAGKCRVHWKTEVGVSRYAVTGVQEYDSLVVGGRVYGELFFGREFDGIAIDWCR
jgi:hypothetical protein